jgi:hypothetical protein
MHVNKVHHVTTITQVAKNLGEDEIGCKREAEAVQALKCQGMSASI